MKKHRFFVVSTAFAVALPSIATAQTPPPPTPTPPPVRSRVEADREIGIEAQRQYDRIVYQGLHDILEDGGKKLGRGEFEPLRAAQKAVQRKDAKAALPALARANSAVSTPFGRLALGMLELETGKLIGDEDLSTRGTDRMVDSGETPAKLLPTLLKNQATYAVGRRDMVKAETAFGRYLALKPTDADVSASLAQVKANLGKRGEALVLLDKAIAMKKASGQAVPEIWIRVADQTRASLVSR